MDEITLELALDFANQIVYEKTDQYLTDLEVIIFKESWKGLTYLQIATQYGYSKEYLNNDVGYNFWDKLSKVLGEKVKKNNFKTAIQRKMVNSGNQTIDSNSNLQNASVPDEFLYPEGSEPLTSPFYIERDDIENRCKQKIKQPGSLIRIKAPNRLGKTSLITQVIDYAITHNYKTVRLEFDSVNRDILKNIDKLYRWICVMICDQIEIESRLDEYWKPEIFGYNGNCTRYFENYLIPTINAPLVLVLDDVDLVFPYSEVIEDFLGMLRSWHEKGKISALWQKVRLIIAHSTEDYIPLDFNQSPFNVGEPVELKDFEPQQVLTLVHRHQLDWNQTQVESLMNMVGGHPYLIRLALYQIGSGKVTKERFLKEATTEAGIYRALLRRYLQILRKDPELSQAYQKVVTASKPVALDPMEIWRLDSLGLVHSDNDVVVPRCNLYRQYFARVL